MRPGNNGRELFGTERLDRVLGECGLGPTRDCTERMTNALAAFTRGAAPTDDQTMLVLRANGLAPERINACVETRRTTPDGFWPPSATRGRSVLIPERLILASKLTNGRLRPAGPLG